MEEAGPLGDLDLPRCRAWSATFLRGGDRCPGTPGGGTWRCRAGASLLLLPPLPREPGSWEEAPGDAEPGVRRGRGATASPEPRLAHASACAELRECRACARRAARGRAGGGACAGGGAGAPGAAECARAFGGGAPRAQPALVPAASRAPPPRAAEAGVAAALVPRTAARAGAGGDAAVTPPAGRVRAPWLAARALSHRCRETEARPKRICVKPAQGSGPPPNRAPRPGTDSGTSRAPGLRARPAAAAGPAPASGLGRAPFPGPRQVFELQVPSCPRPVSGWRPRTRPIPTDEVSGLSCRTWRGGRPGCPGWVRGGLAGGACQESRPVLKWMVGPSSCSVPLNKPGGMEGPRAPPPLPGSGPPRRTC
ncbi:skin secretory protein xP2-like [Pan paniscus]|uniref:skin secretory protein xP2-like n=1 Tax=Pan paniscus TaxID=9597 RepID=UPI0030048A23